MLRAAFAAVMLMAAAHSDAQIFDTQVFDTQVLDVQVLDAQVFNAQVLDNQVFNVQVFDLAAIKCKEFLALKQDRIGSILLWLDGYYTADEDPVVVDFERARTKAEKLGAYCAQHPTLSLIAAAENVLGK
jgi:acid stress chaperone HdeB